MSIATRLKALERGRTASPEPDAPCPGPVTYDLDHGEPIPPDAPRCRLCGEVHAQRVIEEVIEP